MTSHFSMAAKLSVMFLFLAFISNQESLSEAREVCRGSCSPEFTFCSELCLNEGFIMGGVCRLLKPTDKWPTCCCLYETLS